MLVGDGVFLKKPRPRQTDGKRKETGYGADYLLHGEGK